MATEGAPKWPRGSGKGCTPRFWGVLNKFFDPSTLSMRKVDDGEKKKEKKKRKKRMLFIVATYIVAS